MQLVSQQGNALLNTSDEISHSISKSS